MTRFSRSLFSLLAVLYLFTATPVFCATEKSDVSALSYTNSSVLSSGKFIKIAVNESGIYKLTYSDLASMGITPANVRIFGYGGEVQDQTITTSVPDDLPEVAIYMEKGSDGIFNSGDYILFYAKGVNKWSYNSALSMFTHTLNPYSTKGYYFVTSDTGTGKKIETKAYMAPSGSTVVPVETFTDYVVFEKELYNLANSGKEFYGERFNENSTSSTFAAEQPNIDTSSELKVRIDVAANASTTSSFTLLLDNAQSKLLNVPAYNGDSYQTAMAASGIFTYYPTKDQLNFKLTYNLPNSSANAYLNYIELNSRRKLKMSGASMPFRNVSLLGTGKYAEYKLTDAGSNVQIWDITDASNICRVEASNSSGTIVFTADGSTLKQFIAVDLSQSASVTKPEVIGQVSNQDLHAMPQAEMLIITSSKFLSQAERLAQAHRTTDNMRVNIATNEQIFNEFSSGTPDATAYRRFAKMFYDRAKNSGVEADRPKYLLLFGKGTFDNRKLLSASGENLILTYQADESLNQIRSYVTDDYFGFVNDGEGSYVPSATLGLGVGRFPVTTTTQADIVVNKTINYMKDANKGKWKNRVCFLADDGDNSLHLNQADSIARTVNRLFPSYQITKIYLDAYKQVTTASGESYPEARKQMHDMFTKGLLYFNYTGHASAMGMSNENVITTTDVTGFTNSILPIWVGATCDFLQYDNKSVSAGENVILNENGGGIGILSAARPVYAYENFEVNRHFTENLFKLNNGEHYRIGDVLVIAKNRVGSQTNKLSYVYMGDPALKLAFPSTYNVNTLTINGTPSATSETLNALSVAEVTGEITDNNKNRIPDFNGTVYVDVFDKVQQITTQNNHGEGSVVYKDRTNVLFSGKATVTNGQFRFTFMIPKDIRYNFGNGRINYYAASTDSKYEAQGNYENLIIGGTNSSVEMDTEGPEIELYLNSTNFDSGDKVNETPLIIAHLKDKNGINQAGNGIGHDIQILLDGNSADAKVVNEYFEANENSYTEGSLRYKLSALSEGEHSLTLKAWDLMNNSSDKTIVFNVVKGLRPMIFTIANYPNPAKDNTYIVISHDRPETILKTKVEIFNLTGEKIREFQQNNADNISWDLTGFNGSKVRAGIYIYRVSISTSNSDVYSRSNKILIIE